MTLRRFRRRALVFWLRHSHLVILACALFVLAMLGQLFELALEAEAVPKLIGIRL